MGEILIGTTTCTQYKQNTKMHHVLITLTLTFIQGHTDLNRENNNCSIMSEKVFQAICFKFSVKIVRQKVYMTIANPMTLTFIQGHKCVSNLTTFKLAISRTIFKLFHSKLACRPYAWPWTWPWLWKRLKGFFLFVFALLLLFTTTKIQYDGPLP